MVVMVGRGIHSPNTLSEWHASILSNYERLEIQDHLVFGGGNHDAILMLRSRLEFFRDSRRFISLNIVSQLQYSGSTSVRGSSFSNTAVPITTFWS